MHTRTDAGVARDDIPTFFQAPDLMSQPSNFVSAILGSYDVVVTNVSLTVAASLHDLGGIPQQDTTVWLLRAADEATLGTLLMRLRDLGVSFSFDWGWGPAAVFESLRERGIVQGSYQQISWRGPDDWTITPR